MRLVIDIKMENAAFQDDPCREAYRILDNLLRNLKSDNVLPPISPARINLYDFNGNHVGDARLIDG